MEANIGIIVGGILALCGAVSAIGGAVSYIAKAVKAARSPNAAQDKRIEKIEQDLAKVHGFLDTDKKRLDKLEDGNRVTQRALLALLGHGIDGNNQKQMLAAKEDLESHLINR